jgi:O-antigen/teichoic acid export membrane protein
VTNEGLAEAPDRADHAHRTERGRRLRLTIFTALATKPLAFLIPLVTVPMFLRYLGAERYGLYESIGAIGAWLALSNAGMGLGLMNRLTECYVSGDRELARRYVSTLTVALVGIGFCLLAVVTLAIPFVRWERVFTTQDPLAAVELPWAVWWVTMLTVAGLFLSLPAAIYAAYQDQSRSNLWDAAAKVVTLAAAVAVLYTHLGLVGVILAMTGATVAVRLLNIAYLFFAEKPWLRPRAGDFDRSLLSRLLLEGLALLALQTAMVAIFQTDKLIISNSLGPEAVTGYAIVGRLFMAIQGLVMLFLSPLWPAYGEAIQRGDVAWARRTYMKSLLFGCGAMVAGGLTMFFFHRDLLRLWTREECDVSGSLVLAMTASYTTWIWIGCHSLVLNAAGLLRPQLILMTAHALLNLLVATVLVRHWGVVGVAWAIAISGAATTLWGYPWVLWRHAFRSSRFV